MRRQHKGEPSATAWPPDPDLISAARLGDRDALGTILGLGFPKLVAFYRGMGLPPWEAQDIASDAIEGMVRSIGRLREVNAFEGWFWTIARNRIRTNLRTRARVTYELAPAPVDDPADLSVISEEHGHIRDALSRLSPKDRQVLWLHEVEELSHEEIAGRLGMGAGAVRVATHRARRRLEAIYTKSLPVPE